MVEYPPPSLSPEEFEKSVRAALDIDSVGLKDYESNHKEVIASHDGEYEFDVTIRFSALGFEYITLVECKKYKRKVEREKVMVLWAKIQSVGAHKGVIFSTGGYQLGAITYAENHHIALVHVTDGETSLVAKAFPTEDLAPEYVLPVALWVINETAAGTGMRSIANEKGRRLCDYVPDLLHPADASAPSA
jgi:restriction system protein